MKWRSKPFGGPLALNTHLMKDNRFVRLSFIEGDGVLPPFCLLFLIKGLRRTITVDIISKEALDLLRDLEKKNLIRLHEDRQPESPSKTDWIKFKGAMSKEPLEKINHMLHELRSEWE